MSHSSGYWSGMSGGLKAWFISAVLYFVAAGAVFLQQPILGTVMFVLPAFWVLTKNYIFAHFFLKTDFERSSTLSGYTINYLLFRASTLTQVITGSAVMLAVVFGLGWVSTEDLRLKAAEPTLTERVSGAASSVVEATKETTGGWAASAKETTGSWAASAKETTRDWVSAAKGWFSDDEQTAEAE